jgi:NitT/TauT family transport system ATP-binding protein
MLDLQHISVCIGNKTIIQDISLRAEGGDFIAVFGPNGAGKSTLLKTIAGLQQIQSGHITTTTFDGKPARIGMVFQNYQESLLPWHTAKKNIDIVLQARYDAGEKAFSSASYRNDMIDHLFGIAGISSLAQIPCGVLSGGQQQIVSLCRALAYQPDILLLDEPFSALDYFSARMAEDTLLRLWDEQSKHRPMVALCISHNPDNAIILADRICILSRHPATLTSTLDVPLLRPRTTDILTAPEFIALRTTMISLLRSEYEHGFSS